MLRIEERRVGDIIILDLHGRIRPGRAELSVVEKVNSVLSKGERNLILNLADARSSDGSGISAMLGAFLAAREAGGELKLLNVTRRMTNLLIIVALYNHFAAFDSEPEAIQSFQPIVCSARLSVDAEATPWDATRVAV